MWIFYFVGLLCLVAAPLIFSFFAGQFFFGTLSWGRQLFFGRRDARKLLEGRPARALTAGDASAWRFEAPAADDRRALDTALIERRGPFDVEHGATLDGIRVLSRTRSMVVDHLGEKVGFPWTRDERRTSEHVLYTSIIADCTAHLSSAVALHADARADEVNFGDDALFVAFVTSALRATVRDSDRIAISEGYVIVQTPFANRDGRLAPLVEAIAAACRRLVDTTEDGQPDVARLLLDALEHDPDPTIRARAIDRLLQSATPVRRFVPRGQQPMEPTTRDEVQERGLAMALADTSPLVRFAAARHLHEDGFDVAARTLHDEDADDVLRQRALRFLMRRFPIERLMPIFTSVLEQGGERLQLIVVRRLGDLAHAASLPKLCAVADRATRDLAVAIAQALGAIGSPDAEVTLISLYERHDEQVKIVAADALGTLGSAAAVAHLLPAAESTRVSHELRVAASTAVGLIQSRLSGHAGALSMYSPPTTGHLSLKPGGRGALSDTGADKSDPIDLSK